ncbi:MAG: hypothetical protein LBJ46_07495, partial [Planctomycetota bacterium]|nr:hypothetical protein [Planctomycetota bacterium]
MDGMNVNGMMRGEVRPRIVWLLLLGGLALLLAGGASVAPAGEEFVLDPGDIGFGTLRDIIAPPSTPISDTTIKFNPGITGSILDLRVDLSRPTSPGWERLTISGRKSGTLASLFNLTTVNGLTDRLGTPGSDDFWQMALADISASGTFTYGGNIFQAVGSATSSATTMSQVANLPAIGRSTTLSLIMGTMSASANLLSWQKAYLFPTGFSIENIHFNNYDLTVTTGSLTSQHAMIGPSEVFNDTPGLNQTISRIAGNWFDGISISMTVSGSSMVPALFTLRGGNAYGDPTVPGTSSATFRIGEVTGNLFDNVKVKVQGNGNLNGAGWFGTSFGVFSPPPGDSNSYTIFFDHAIGTIADNVFIGDGSNTIEVDNKIQGAGIVGVRVDIDHKTEYNAIPSASSITSFGTGEIGTINGNLFEGLKISAGTQINGAGLVGVYVAATPGSGDTATAKIGAIDRNIFSNNMITAGILGIKGGGLIAVQGNRSDGATEGLSYSAEGAEAKISAVSGNVFFSNRITSGGGLLGGGIIGVNSDNNDATLEDVSNNLFEDITIDISNAIEGGGILAVNSNSIVPSHRSNLESASFNIFTEIGIHAGGNILGGGLIGANAGSDNGGASVAATAAIGVVTGNLFSDVEVNATDDLRGGGVIGSHSVTGMQFGGNQSSTLNSFHGVAVFVGGSLEGGGMIGASADVDGVEMDRIGGNA